MGSKLFVLSLALFVALSTALVPADARSGGPGSFYGAMLTRLGPGNKSIDISNPSGEMSVSIVSGNGTKTIQTEKDFEGIQSIKTINIKPGHAEVELEVETENGTLSRNISAEWKPVMGARVRESVRNVTCEEQCPLINISYDSSLKRR